MRGELRTSWPRKLLTKWRFPPWRSPVRLWAPLSVPRMRRGVEHLNKMRRRAHPTRACRRTPRRRQPCSSDRSVVRAHVSAAGAKGGQEGQALGRSRGGFTTKIHAKSDASGDIIAFDLTGGEASDGRHFETLLDIGPDIRPRAVISRQRLRQQRQSPGSESARRRAGHPAQGQRKTQAGLLRANPLQGKGSHRAGRRTLSSDAKCNTRRH